METCKKKVAGAVMKWIFWTKSVHFYWKSVIIGYADMTDDGHFDVTENTSRIPLGTYNTLDEVIDAFERYVKENIDSIKERHNNKQEQDRIYKQKQAEERAKYYHLDIEDLTPEHNLYYSDLISLRLKNVLHAAEIYTLNDLSKLTAREFLKYRNCGQNTLKEVEEYFKKVGLGWMAASSSSSSPLDKYSDEMLLRECRRRGLIK